MLQQIVDDAQTPMDGEEHLAALTAGDRILWARARTTHFSNGVNKTSLDAIEKVCGNTVHSLALFRHCYS